MRIASIDFIRFVAVYAVIIIHTKPFMLDLFPDPSYRLVEYLFNQPPRFAVPFFFITSGYFLAQKYANGSDQVAVCLQYVKRLLFLLVTWSIVYALIPSDWPRMYAVGYPHYAFEKLRQLSASPLTLLLEGSRVHLWFLSSLISGVIVVTLLVKTGRNSLLIFFSVLLFAVGLLGASYSVTPLGVHLPFYSRNGPFLSTICLAIGFLIYQKGPFRLSPLQAFSIAAAGLSLQVVESWALWKCFAIPMINHDYLIGTVVCATGLLLFALAAPDFGRKGNLYVLGKYTLGIYLCHLLFVDILGPWTPLVELHTWQVLLPIFTFLLSYALTRMLTRWRWSKTLVT
jgi:surface polysaccharide O-acyltransferase-like enzyme